MKHILRTICITTLMIIPCSPVRRQKDKNIEKFIDKLLHSDKFEKLADDIAERTADKLAHLQRTTTDEPTTTITGGEWTGKKFKSRKFEKVPADDSSKMFDYEVPSKRSEDLNIDIDKEAVVQKFRSQRDPDLTLRYKHFTKAEDSKHSSVKKRRKTKTPDDNFRMRAESDEEVTTKKSHRKHTTKKSSHVPDDSDSDVANASSSRGSDSDELSLPIKLTELEVQESKKMLKTTHKYKDIKKVHHKSDDKKKEGKEVEEEEDVSIEKKVDNKKSAEERKTKIRVVVNQKNQSVENDTELSQKDKERNKKGNSTTKAVDLKLDKSEEESKRKDRSIKTNITEQVTKNVTLKKKNLPENFLKDKNDNNSTMVTDNTTTRSTNLTIVIDKTKNTNKTTSDKKVTSDTRINNDTKVDTTTMDTTADDSNDEIDTTKRSHMTTVTETERTEEIDFRNVLREENGKLFAFNNGSDYEEYHDNIAKQVSYAKTAQKSRKNSRKGATFSLPDFF